MLLLTARLPVPYLLVVPGTLSSSLGNTNFTVLYSPDICVVLLPLLANRNAPPLSRDPCGPMGARRHGRVTRAYVMAREFPIVYRLWMGSVSGEYLCCLISWQAQSLVIVLGL